MILRNLQELEIYAGPNWNSQSVLAFVGTKQERQFTLVFKHTVRVEERTKHCVLAIKENYSKKRPLTCVPSFLITLCIFEYLDQREVFSFLQDGSHVTRAYFTQRKNLLVKRLKQFTGIPSLKTMRSAITVLQMLGRPEKVLQTV